MTINSILSSMRNAGRSGDVKAKGDLGEEAVLQLCINRKNKVGGGLLFNSFQYRYAADEHDKVYTGNLFFDLDTQTFRQETRAGINDEIDILYVTPYRMFSIEVKSYHTKEIHVYDVWMDKYMRADGRKAGMYPVDKSAIAQAEKHARHLYHTICSVLPDGDPFYIVPMVCFVDRCKLKDDRPDDLIDYLPVCVLNTFLKTFNKYNTPRTYNLDLTEINDKLHKIATSIKMEI